MDDERAKQIGELWSCDISRNFAEMLIDLEESPVFRVRVLQDVERLSR